MKRIFFGLFFLSFCAGTTAQAPFQVYYLTVASEHYEHNSKKFREKNFIPYDDLPEATASAEIMTLALRQFAKARGITLLSTEKKRITKKYLFSGLDSLAKKMKLDKPANPLVIFYYCGHGISENLGWNQFMVPGNYSSVAGSKNVDVLSKELIYLGDITDKLGSLGYRYMVLLDCCRKEEKDNSLPEARLRYFFDEQNLQTIKTMATVVKMLNEYHQKDPVIFSIEPGNSTPVVSLPNNEITKSFATDTSMQVGPLCRRTLIALDEIETGKNKYISLQQFVQKLTAHDFDNGSSPSSVSYYTQLEDEKRQYIIFRQ